MASISKWATTFGNMSGSTSGSTAGPVDRNLAFVYGPERQRIKQTVTGGPRRQNSCRPDAYTWSSYHALAGLAGKPDWLDAKPVYAQLAPGKSASQAAARYAEFVVQGRGAQLWDDHLKQQIYLGDDDFIARMQKHAGLDRANPAATAGGKANVRKIHTSAPTHDGELKRYILRIKVKQAPSPPCQ